MFWDGRSAHPRATSVPGVACRIGTPLPRDRGISTGGRCGRLLFHGFLRWDSRLGTSLVRSGPVPQILHVWPIFPDIYLQKCSNLPVNMAYTEYLGTTWKQTNKPSRGSPQQPVVHAAQWDGTMTRTTIQIPLWSWSGQQRDHNDTVSFDWNSPPSSR